MTCPPTIRSRPELPEHGVDDALMLRSAASAGAGGSKFGHHALHFCKHTFGVLLGIRRSGTTSFAGALQQIETLKLAIELNAHLRHVLFQKRSDACLASRRGFRRAGLLGARESAVHQTIGSGEQLRAPRSPSGRRRRCGRR